MTKIQCSCSVSSMNDRYSNDIVSIERSITRRWIQGFETAKAASYFSDGFKNRNKMGAAIFSGSRLLSIGCNQYSKTGPKFINSNVYNISLHAEQSALGKIKYRNYSTNKLICYVVRLNANNQYVVSRPCDRCIEALTEAGIHSVRFVNRNGNAEEIILRKGN